MTPRLALASATCIDRPILELLPAMREAGVQAIEVSTPTHHFNLADTTQVRRLQDALPSLGMRAVSIHAPFGGTLDLADPNPQHRDGGVDAALIAADVIQSLGGDVVVVHPSDLERNGHDVPARLADCAAALAVVAETCRQEGLTLAIETPLPHLIGGHPDEMQWLLSHMGADVRVCLDTGHTHLGRHWHRFLEIAKGRVHHVHAHDNRSHWDDHLPPGEGHIDWAEIGRSLAAAGFDGWVVLELHCPGDTHAGFYRRVLERTSSLLSGGGPS